MRYPVSPGGSQQEFDESWTLDNGYKFGDVRPYGLHDGYDINLKTGGDTDLGQEIITICGHLGKLPTTAAIAYVKKEVGTIF